MTTPYPHATAAKPAWDTPAYHLKRGKSALHYASESKPLEANNFLYMAIEHFQAAGEPEIAARVRAVWERGPNGDCGVDDLVRDIVWGAAQDAAVTPAIAAE